MNTRRCGQCSILLEHSSVWGYRFYKIVILNILRLFDETGFSGCWSAFLLCVLCVGRSPKILLRQACTKKKVCCSQGVLDNSLAHFQTVLFFFVNCISNSNVPFYADSPVTQPLRGLYIYNIYTYTRLVYKPIGSQKCSYNQFCSVLLMACVSGVRHMRGSINE